MLFRTFAVYIKLGLMKQSAMLEFKCSLFVRVAGEDEHTNPGVFGKALAEWLLERLPENGVTAGAVVPEDFGWCIPVESKPGATFIACSSASEDEDMWRVFVFTEGGGLARFFGGKRNGSIEEETYAAVKRLLQAEPTVIGLSEVAP